MKTYIAERHLSMRNASSPDCRVMVEQPGRAPYPLRHIVFHSTVGFDWGFDGSGPADLALSILADHFGELRDTSLKSLATSQSYAWHQSFKSAFLECAGTEGFTVTSEDIAAWFATQRVSQ